MCPCGQFSALCEICEDELSRFWTKEKRFEKITPYVFIYQDSNENGAPKGFYCEKCWKQKVQPTQVGLQAWLTNEPTLTTYSVEYREDEAAE